jgi:hypothetical protein
MNYPPSKESGIRGGTSFWIVLDIKHKICYYTFMTLKTSTYIKRVINLTTLLITLAALINLNTVVFLLTAFTYMLLYPFVGWILSLLVEKEYNNEHNGPIN